MKKVLFFAIIIMTGALAVRAQNYPGNSVCSQTNTKKASLNFLLTYGKGPSMDLQVGVGIRPIAFFGGVKYITDTSNKKIIGKMNTPMAVGTCMLRIMTTEKTFVSPYMTIGEKSYFEVGMRGGYVIGPTVALIAGTNYAQKKIGFTGGLLVFF